VSAATSVTTLCPSLPGGDNAGGIYPAKGGAFVEDWSTGNLVFCSGGTSKTIAMPPAGGASNGYWGMAGIQTTPTTLGLLLLLISSSLQGFWLCGRATSAGCGLSGSVFITLPASFCSSEPTHTCDPRGVALDNSLNVYYVDGNNAKLVECTYTSNYQTCSNLPASSALSGHVPEGLVLKGTSFYISDGGCSGKVWKGTKSSLSVIASKGEDLSSIALSAKNPTKTTHVYVGYAGGDCTTNPTKILDLTDRKVVFSQPFQSIGFGVPGLDSNLQFTIYSPGAAYQASDTS